MAEESPYTLFVGVDIAAKSASVAHTEDVEHVQPAFDIKQTKKGIEHLKKRLLATGHAPEKMLVVIEVTGNYWWQIALALHEAGYAISLVNGARASYFARAMLKRAKTDHIDAQTLAQIAASLQPKLWTPPPKIHGQLHQRLAEREDLLKNRTAALNRLHALKHHPRSEEPVLRRVKELADFLQKQITEIEKEIGELLKEDEEWSESARWLLQVKGVGIVTAAWILVVTNNFTSCDAIDQLVSYAGLAPRVRQSGTSVNGRRFIGHAGSNQLRKVLYMAALNAIRFNPILKAYYQRLRDRGKPFKVALCACARKLLAICWAVGTKKVAFDPLYQQHKLPLAA